MGISLDEVILDSGSTVTVVATDLDIRDLAFATDKVDVTGSEVSLDATTLAALETINAVQSGTWDIGTLTSITNDVNIADGGNSITVDAVDLDIRNLSASQDNVAISDGSDTLAINADGSINVKGGSDTTIKTTTETVTTTAAEVLATPLAGRREVTIQNEGSSDVYVGSVVGVTSATGIKISKNSSATYSWGDAVDIFMVAGSGSQSVRFLESA